MRDYRLDVKDLLETTGSGKFAAQQWPRGRMLALQRLSQSAEKIVESSGRQIEPLFIMLIF